MTALRSRVLGVGIAFAIVGALMLTGAGAASAATRVATIKGFKAPGTPDRLNKVRIVKYGGGKRKHVLVLNPGTSAGGTFFGPVRQGADPQAQGLAGLGDRAPREPARGPLLPR